MTFFIENKSKLIQANLSIHNQILLILLNNLPLFNVFSILEDFFGYFSLDFYDGFLNFLNFAYLLFQLFILNQ